MPNDESHAVTSPLDASDIDWLESIWNRGGTVGVSDRAAELFLNRKLIEPVGLMGYRITPEGIYEVRRWRFDHK